MDRTDPCRVVESDSPHSFISFRSKQPSRRNKSRNFAFQKGEIRKPVLQSVVRFTFTKVIKFAFAGRIDSRDGLRSNRFSRTAFSLMKIAMQDRFMPFADQA